MSLVSVIIPAYNAASCITECLESVLVQTHRDLEVIVVDDGSTDATGDLANAVRDPRIQVLRQTNRGAAAARNAGLSRCRGDYVQYLDADDLLSPRKIEKQLAALERSPTTAIASCPWAKFTHSVRDAECHPEPVWEEEDPIEWLLASWLGGGMMQTACWLTPRKLIETAGPWDESLVRNPNDDGEFFCRILVAANRIHFVRNACVHYRCPSKTNVSQQSSKTAMSSLLGSYEKYQHTVLQRLDNQRVRRALANNYFSFVYQVFPNFPDLVSRAYIDIGALGVNRPVTVGGKTFRIVSSAIGFRNAMRIRHLINRFRHR
jgi:glycosyltransferase involved in cell wall biosynthesis